MEQSRRYGRLGSLADPAAPSDLVWLVPEADGAPSRILGCLSLVRCQLAAAPARVEIVCRVRDPQTLRDFVFAGRTISPIADDAARLESPQRMFGSANPFALIPFCHGIFGLGALVSICGGGSKEDWPAVMSKLKRIQVRARKLAKSGKFYGWSPIAFALRFEDGFEEAREWLYTTTTIDLLNRICRESRASNDEAPIKTRPLKRA